jgi:tetratricopeptide (TPR) repeat protein
MRSFVVLLLAVTAFAQSSSDNKTEESLERGIKLFKAAKYDAAIRAFEQAARSAPKDIRVYLFIAAAYMSRYRPGDDSHANLDLARRAEAALIRPLAIDPWNRIALWSMADLKFQQAKDTKNPAAKLSALEESERWFRRLLEVDARDRESLYNLGVIAWLKARTENQRVRAGIGMSPEQAGPLPDATARLELKKRTSRTIEDGIANLQKALQVDPRHDEAMNQINLLLREAAVTADTGDDYEKRMAEAATWERRAAEAKNAKAAGAASSDRKSPPSPRVPR